MGAYRWVIDAEELKRYAETRLDRPSPKAIKKYYQGFSKEKPMYQEELADLEKVYKDTLKKLQKDVEICLPNFLHYMEKFLTLHKSNEAIREKLDALLAKTRREPPQEDNGGDYDDE